MSIMAQPRYFEVTLTMKVRLPDPGTYDHDTFLQLVADVESSTTSDVSPESIAQYMAIDYVQRESGTTAQYYIEDHYTSHAEEIK